MRKRIFKVVKMAEDFISANDFSHKEEFLGYLGRWIGYFQHERLVHLVVTVCFAIMSMLSILGLYITNSILFACVFLLFVITSGFYVEHYFILENKTQYLYELYDEIEEK